MKTRPLALCLALAFAFGGTALAGGGKKKSSGDKEKTEQADEVSSEEAKYKQVKMGKIKEFKPTYKATKDLLATVTTFETQVNTIHATTKEAAGVAKDDPLKKAFNSMKQKGKKKLIVALNTGQTPRLSVEKDAPDNVRTFADQVNANLDTCASILDNARSIPDQAQGLVEEIAAMPGKITPDLLLKNNLKVGDLNKQVNVAKNNLEAAKSIKPRTLGVVNSVENYFSLVRSLAETD